MKFVETGLDGAFLLEPELIEDHRGFFARAYSRGEFKERGLMDEVREVYDSFSTRVGTLRGMHYQLQPRAETKIVRCIRGSVYDVILDLRPASDTFGKYFGAELSGDNRRSMYIPRGFAHGFLSLSDSSELLYFVDEEYSPEQARGVRWDDRKFGIEWPGKPSVISDRDAEFPDFDPEYHLK